jgi:glycosyltransferase involved in cell wall biosynthesis
VNTKSQTLILLTNHFPFGAAESFIENEIPFLEKSFDRIFIIAKDVDSLERRPTGSNVEVIRLDPKSNRKELLTVIFLVPIFLLKITKFTFQEIIFIGKQNLSFRAVTVMFHDLTKGLIYGHCISRVVRQNRLSNITVYSYWLTSSALATLFIHPTTKIKTRISRAHGGDVYESRNDLNYLSFRTVLVKYLTRIYTISDDARGHLLDAVGQNFSNKIKTSRLGTSPPQKVPDVIFAEPFIMVSCSFMVPVKRIHLIIEALSILNDVRIQWIHFGDGPLKDQLTQKALELLSGKSNISFDLRPSLPNRELIRFYEQNQVHLFINVSSSEGIPVSIMEAQSFGIPTIGPSTGGVPEIVSDNCGKLILQTASSVDISNAIREILRLPPPAYFELRQNARRNWQLKFSADQNFPSFVSGILSSEENKTS